MANKIVVIVPNNSRRKHAMSGNDARLDVLQRLQSLPLLLNEERLKKDRNGIKYAFNFNGFNLDDGKQSGG